MLVDEGKAEGFGKRKEGERGRKVWFARRGGAVPAELQCWGLDSAKEATTHQRDSVGGGLEGTCCQRLPNN